MARLFPWLVRVAWILQPFVVGPALAIALDDRSDTVRSTSSVALWASWAAVLVAALVAHPISLTVIRLAAPASVAYAVVAAAAAEATTVSSAIGVAWAALTLLVIYSPAVGEAFVNGSAYPNERRLPLRAPGPLMLGPLQVAVFVVVGGPTAVVLLASAGRWSAAVVLALLALPAAVLLARALHGLSCRWLVFLPAGVVVHDPIGLADPILLRKETVATIAPAPAGTAAVDLTQRAFGLAIEIALREPTPIVRMVPRRTALDQGAVDALLVTPTRPGEVLAEAAERRLPIA
ncbi:MAG: hypothetical protein ACR2H3_02605 [Acidimicrobiales bacterium]